MDLLWNTINKLIKRRIKIRIDLKQEILQKEEKNNERIELYNSVINKYIPQIKDICNGNELKFEHYLDKRGLIELKFYSQNEKTKYYFNYKCIERELKLNRLDDNATIQVIENQLKLFILGIAEKEDIRIKKNDIKTKNEEYHLVVDKKIPKIEELFTSNEFKMITYGNLNAKKGIKISKEYIFECKGDFEELFLDCEVDDVKTITSEKLKEFIKIIIDDNPTNLKYNTHLIKEILD